MNHLIISREYPPAAYIGGGIGAYVDHISRLLAENGETVHVIAQLCPGAPREREVRIGGRLIVHRVPVDKPLAVAKAQVRSPQAFLDALRDSVVPCQAFAWQAAWLAEALIDQGAIDVVEAQEYEAPTSFLMLRRAIGLGTRHHVPIVVHLHSPSEFLFAENECTERSDYLPLTTLEDYVIRGADALLSPSRFLATAIESRYQLKSAVEVIPYLSGSAKPALSRSDATWREGTICYVGRLEPRKGVREWADAAVAVAADDSALHFTFVGSDTLYRGIPDRSMRSILRGNIPPSVQARFAFSEALPRHRLVAHRARARIAVVPSRWENFPYTCIEAMASGLPVLASPNGGMAEMIEDGRTGWIAAGSDARSLEAALRRAVATPASKLAEMGAAAAKSIAALCGDDEIVRRHMEFKRRVVSRGCRPMAEMPSPPATFFDHLAGPPATAMRGMETRTMSPIEIVRAPRAQQLAVMRRALTNPAYVARWVAWHARRLATSKHR